jgi:hypothetical protein
MENLRKPTKATTFRHTVYEVLVYDALNKQVFDSIADLSDAVKATCARHRIKYNGDDVAKAIRSVGSRRRLL